LLRVPPPIPLAPGLLELCRQGGTMVAFASAFRAVRARVLSTPVRRGVLSMQDEAFLEPDALSFEEPAMALCYGDAMQGRLAFDEGSGQRIPPRSNNPEYELVEIDWT